MKTAKGIMACPACKEKTPVSFKKPTFLTNSTFKVVCMGCDVEYLVVAARLRGQTGQIGLFAAPANQVGEVLDKSEMPKAIEGAKSL